MMPALAAFATLCNAHVGTVSPSLKRDMPAVSEFGLCSALARITSACALVILSSGLKPPSGNPVTKPARAHLAYDVCCPIFGWHRP